MLFYYWLTWMLNSNPNLCFIYFIVNENMEWYYLNSLQMWHACLLLCHPHSSSSSSSHSSRQRCSHWLAVEVWQCLRQGLQLTLRSASWSSSSWSCCFTHTSASDESKLMVKSGHVPCLTAEPWRTSSTTWPTVRLANPARVSSNNF